MGEYQITIEKAENDLLACAAFLATNIKNSDGHGEAMLEIVPHFLEKGEVDLAAQFADAVDDPFVRDRLLTLTAEKCAACATTRLLSKAKPRHASKKRTCCAFIYYARRSTKRLHDVVIALIHVNVTSVSFSVASTSQGQQV